MACAHPTNSMIWMSYAVPLSAHRQDVVDWAAVVAELRAWFKSHDRQLRFEILEPLWPELAPELVRQGVKLQGRMPLMLCGPGDLRVRAVPVSVSIEPVTAESSDDAIRELLTTARRGFADAPDPTDQDVTEQRAALAAGRYRCVLAHCDGRPAGAGSMSIGNDELVGIATLPEYRRRGIAAAVSSRLVAEHFEKGAGLAWLSAGDQVARAVYEGIGFRVVGDQVNLQEG